MISAVVDINSPSRSARQQVTMLRHQDVTDDSEAQLLAQVSEGLDEFPLEGVGVKNASAPVRVDSEIMKVFEAVIVRAAGRHAFQFSFRSRWPEVSLH